MNTFGMRGVENYGAAVAVAIMIATRQADASVKVCVNEKTKE